MKYKENKSKRKYLWNESKKVQDALEKEVQKSTIIKNNIINIKPERFNIVRDNYSTEWEKTETNEFSIIYKEWEIIINAFPEKFIPYIKCSPIYRIPAGITFSPRPGSYKQNRILFEIKDILDTPKLKKVIIHAYLYFGGGEYNPYVKLLVRLYNPQVFI